MIMTERDIKFPMQERDISCAGRLKTVEIQRSLYEDDFKEVMNDEAMKKIVDSFFQSVKNELPGKEAHSRYVILLILSQIEAELDYISLEL